MTVARCENYIENGMESVILSRSGRIPRSVVISTGGLDFCANFRDRGIADFWRDYNLVAK